MKDLKLFTTSAACALGAAMLVTTALQSTPAEAREKANGHTAREIQRAEGKPHGENKHPERQPQPAEKQPHGEKQPAEKQPLPNQLSVTIAKLTQAPIPSATSAANSQSGGTKATSSSSGNGGSRPTLGNGGDLIPVPIQSQSGGIKATNSQSGGIKATSSSSGNGGTIPVQPQSGGRPPPVITATPTTQAPNPPLSTSSNNSGGGKLPPVITATPAPIPPTTVPINPGNYPGGSIPPISTVPIPTPIPVPIPTGSTSNPGYGTGTTYTHQYGQHGVYADIGAGGGDYGPCLLFKSNYDRTGNVYWLNRYRVCLWQR
jgi:hypothetical protein